MFKYLHEILQKLKSNDLIRKDFRSFLEFGIGYALMLAVNLLVVREINRTLTKVEMGRFSFISSLVQLLMPVVTFSAQQAYVRFQKEHQISAALRKFLLPFFWTASLILAVLVFCLTRSWLAVLYACAPLFVEKTYLLRCQLCIGRMNVLQVLSQLVILAALLIGCRYFKFTADIVLGLYGMSYLTAVFFLPRKFSDDAVEKHDVLRYLWPIVFTTLCTAFLANCSVIIARYFFDDATVGSIGVAARMALSFNCMFDFFMMFYPLIYMREAAKNNFKLIALYRRIIMLIAFTLFAGMVLCGKYIYLILGAGKYLDSTMLFVILAGVILFNFIANIYWLYFDYEIKTWKNMLLRLTSCLIVLAGIWAVPYLGVYYIGALLLAATAVPALIGMVLALHKERCHIRNIKHS